MKNDDKKAIYGILKYISQIEGTIERLNLTQDTFSLDYVGKNSISMCIQTIGEYANDLSNELQRKYNEVPWRKMIDMRNRFAHGYDSMDEDIIWEVATFYIPELKNYLEKISKDLQKNE
ncbi:MAG: DUF86 domain-containing protein [Defluviitaleaceae bacterium]|nr:DUF86 domain-containing protein [Defluviitaleaceae bacterium]